MDVDDGYLDIDGFMFDMALWWYNNHGVAMTPHC